MAQYDFKTINPSTYSGTDLSTDLNGWVQAVITNHSGTSRPSYITSAGVGVWHDTANSALKFYNGSTDDILAKGAVTSFGQQVIESADAAALQALADVYAKAQTVDQDSDTGAANIPVGTTAQEPVAGDGKARFNTSTNEGVMGAGSSYHNIINDRTGNAGGTADVITVTFSRPLLSWANGVSFRVRASGANTSTTPTINPNAIGAKTIVKHGNSALIAGDISGADHEMILVYNSTNDNVELLNPASQSGADTDLSNLTATGNDRIASAWVNFDGTATVTIRDQHNVSSITDNGVGDYTVNFTNALANANYSCSATAGGRTTTASNIQSPYNATPTTSLTSVATFNTGWAAPQDCDDIAVQVFGGN